MKNGSLIMIIVLAVSATHVAVTNSASQEQVAAKTVVEDSSKKIDSLLKERRDVLKQLVKLAKERHREGAEPADNVIRASLALLEAELELARSRRERVEIHKQAIALLRELEKMADLRFRAGTARKDVVLRAKASRLEAEIQLLREESAK